MARQAVLRHGNDQVEIIEPGPGPADMDIADCIVRLALNPAADRLVTKRRGDDQVRPGWGEGAGATYVDARQSGPTQQVDGDLALFIGQALGFKRPTQRLRERENLGIVA